MMSASFADFHEAKGLFQETGVATWNWKMADINRFMAYSVVPGLANRTVSVAPPVVVQDTGGQASVKLTVTLARFDQGGSPAGLINFFAARIPPQ
jgi:hypothetical protein